MPVQKKQPIWSPTFSQNVQIATALPSSRGQASANVTIREKDEGWGDAISTNDDDSNDDLRSLHELFDAASPRPFIRDEAPRIESSLQQLEQHNPIQANQTKAEIGASQGQPIYLDNDKSERAFTEDAGEGADDIETGCDGRDMNTLFNSQHIDTSNLQYDADKGQYINEPLSASAEPSPQILSPLHPDFDGWTDDSTAELEEAVELAIAEQKNSLTCTPSLLSLPSIHAPEEKTGTPRNTETTHNPPQEPQRDSRQAPALQGWERQCAEEINHSRHIDASSLSRLAPGEKKEVVNLGQERRNEGTRGQISCKRQNSVDTDATYATGCQRLAKRRVLSLTAALSTSHTRATDGHTPEPSNENPQSTSNTSRQSSVASKDFSTVEHEEFDELDDADNSEDETYCRDTTSSDEDEDFQVAKQSMRSSQPRKRLRLSAKTENIQSRYRCEPISQVKEQLNSPPNSQSSTPAPSIPAAEYQEWNVQGILKSTRIGHIRTFNLELQVANFPQHQELAPSLEVICNTMAAGISSHSNSNVSSSPHIRPHTYDGDTQTPRQLVRPSTQFKPTQSLHQSKRYHKEKIRGKRMRWTVEEEAIVIEMREKNVSWKEIFAAVPNHSPGSITGHWHGNLSRRPGNKKNLEHFRQVTG